MAGEAVASGASEENMSQVKIERAFDSPELLQSCTGFLRDYAQQKQALAACAVVPLRGVAYPQACMLPWTLDADPCRASFMQSTGPVVVHSYCSLSAKDSMRLTLHSRDAE
jgi:hypothetical protein